MLCSKSCCCHFVLSLTVSVGSDHNWCLGFQWISLVAHPTHCICFPCTEGRFGKGGLVNHLRPTTHHIGFLQHRRGGECRQTLDLDHTSMDHTWDTPFIWVVILERATLLTTLKRRESLIDSPLVNSAYAPHTLFSFTSLGYPRLPDHCHQRDVENLVGPLAVHNPFTWPVMLVHSIYQLTLSCHVGTWWKHDGLHITADCTMMSWPHDVPVAHADC